MMHKVRDSKRNRKFCKWMASLLMVALLINQSSFLIQAEESGEEFCLCDICCSVNSINGDCLVCTEDYEKCGGAEQVVVDEEPEISDVSEDVTIDADTNIAPDIFADEEVEVFDVDGDINTNVKTDTLPDGESGDEESIFLQYGEVENTIGEDTANGISVEDTFNDGVFIYKIINEDDRQVEVTGHVDGISASGALEIPSMASDGIDEYAVVCVGNLAFSKCSNLTSVSIPDSVTQIGGSAFYECSNLTGVSIPDGVTQIGGGAFYRCSSLISIIIPDGVTQISPSTFRYCSNLTSITIPDTVTRIGECAFGECRALTSITIPDGVTCIDDCAFEFCWGLTNITIPSSVTTIGMCAFAECHSLTEVKLLNDAVEIGTYAFWDCFMLKSFQIALSENITGTPAIGYSSFLNCFFDRSLIFLTKDGTTVLSGTTTPTLTDAVNVYNAVDDGGINDGNWYGWVLPKDAPVTGYPVTVNVNKDGNTWSDSGRTFALLTSHNTFITELTNVANGTYTIYDTTGATDSTGYVSTGVAVVINDTPVQVEVNYYTVTFYNGDTVFHEQIVLNNVKVNAPTGIPTKDGFIFYRWVVSEDDNVEFNFADPITSKTDIYANWISDAEGYFTITVLAGAGGRIYPDGEVKVKSGKTQRFTITPEEGYWISSILVDGNEELRNAQTIDYLRAGVADLNKNIRCYDFENVTSNHSLEAYFETIQSDGSSDNGSGASSDVDGISGFDSSGGGDDRGNSVSETGESSSTDGGDNSISVINFDTNVASETEIARIGDVTPASAEKEPKTGDAFRVEIYATLAMIAGLSYLLLYFADVKNGMTEEEKKEIVAMLIKWAKSGKRLRRYVALVAIFGVLVYYHAIGKCTLSNNKQLVVGR